MSENYELKAGSKYSIGFSDEENPPIMGEFLGYTMIGTESAIVLKRSPGNKIRFIPVSQIFYIDLIESAEEPAVRSRPENLYG